MVYFLLPEARYFEGQPQTNSPVNKSLRLGQKIYELDLSTTGLVLRKEQLNNSASLLAIDGCTIR